MKRKLILLFGLVAILAPSLSAQFTLDGVIRPRTEFRHGYNKLMGPNDKPAFFTSQRTRLNAGYSMEKMRFYFSLQDVRTWGNTPQLVVNDGFLSVHQGWAEIDLGEMFMLRLGRQELIYDDHRLFGNVGWAQQARSHDLALVKFSLGEWEAHAGLAYNQDRANINGNFYSTRNYKTMQYVWGSGKLGDVILTTIFMNQGLQYTDPAGEVSTQFNQTLGVNPAYKLDALNLAGSAYYQFGKDGNARSLSAYQVALRASYSLSGGEWVPDAAFEILSGTDQAVMSVPGNTSNKSFTPFYGTNHKFNGHMDYFYVGNHINDVGLIDISAGISWKPGKTTWKLTLHQFASHAEILDPVNTGEVMPKNLGTEIDFAFNYKQSDLFAVTVGYSQLFASASMEALKGGDRKKVQNWAWVMLTFTPKFLQAQEEN